VTAAGGLAAPTCRRIAAEGGTVVCADRGASGDGSVPDACLSLDVTSESSWESVLAKVLSRRGRLDGLRLGHGVSGSIAPVEDVTAEQWRQTLDINLTGCFYGLSRVVPAMPRASYGRIVALSSIAGREGSARQSACSSSKGALNALVESVARECAPDAVTVNVIAPTAMGTPMFAELDATVAR
jgi:NAD(P)-dependent dehydrogenase (short-subunit alcohol dehydrogenase family)